MPTLESAVTLVLVAVFFPASCSVLSIDFCWFCILNAYELLDATEAIGAGVKRHQGIKVRHSTISPFSYYGRKLERAGRIH